jgi:chromosome segregation protein
MKLDSPWDLSSLLGGIYCADTYESALNMSRQLTALESVITPDGIWFGCGWLKVNKIQDSKTGVLQREKQLRELKQQHEELLVEIDELEQQLDTTENAIKQAELNRVQLQLQDKQTGTELSAKAAAFSARQTQFTHQRQRLLQIDEEMQDITYQLEETVEHLSESQILLEEAEDKLLQQDEKKQHLDALNQELQSQLQHAEHMVNDARQQVYSTRAQIESLRASETLTIKQIERLQSQHTQAVARVSELERRQQQSISPLADEKSLLKERLIEKDALESRLKDQRLLLTELEFQINSLNEKHFKTQINLEEKKQQLDKLRLEAQEIKVRQQTVNEQLNEVNANAGQLLENMPEKATESDWKRKVEELESRIEKLGTINLTAIEEFRTQSERLNFLDEQHRDLTEALQTLDEAISQIDKQSRLRFKETFDKINCGLQEKFPKLFGGGQAYLELTGQDLQESGVNIIARPPGKKNSSIHLLSGGEKALTAVALVFSIFELNPAPFCLLDEVDAPLDDANVGRFSKMVEEMSTSVQFLYISHNKVTMEIAKQLAGVTMKEPGVSRMVAVDIDEAVNLAEI